MNQPTLSKLEKYNITIFRDVFTPEKLESLGPILTFLSESRGFISESFNFYQIIQTPPLQFFLNDCLDIKK